MAKVTDGHVELKQVEWKSLPRKHKDHFFIRKSTLDINDLNFNKRSKYKLLVHLKPLPKFVNKGKMKKFVCTLIKAVDYEESLLIELNDHVATLIGSDVSLMKKNVIGILKAEDFEELERKKTDLKKAYLKFKRFIVLDGPELEIDAAAREEIYRCQINFDDEGDGEEDRGNSSEYDEDDSYDEDYYYSDDDDEEEDDDEDDDEEEEAEEDDISQNDYSGVENVAQILIKTKESSKTHGNTITLKDACKVDLLRKHIYEVTVKHYQLSCNDINAFYLRLALNYKDESSTTGTNAKIELGNEGLKEVLQVIVTDFKTDFLELLLDQLTSHESLKKTLNKIAEEIIRNCEQGSYDDFLYFLESVDIKFNVSTKSDCYEKLFMDAIVNDKFKASLFYWTKVNHLTGMALLAQYVLKVKLEKVHLKTTQAKYEKYLRVYEDITIKILESCYKKNWLRTWYLLVKVIPNCEESCITIALNTDNKLFLQQQPCTDVNSESWSSYVGEDLDMAEPTYGIKETLLSPKGRCRMDMISYLIFLTAYSVLLVSKLNKTTIHFLEFVVMGYIAIFIIKEFDQCCRQICKSLKQCWYYIIDPFNILDQLSINVAIIAWSLRWLAYIFPGEDRFMIAARYLLCFDFMLYMFRFLEFFYQNKVLGPILVVIRYMVKTYINFLLILTIFLVAYSIVSESILYPGQELTPNIFHTVFRRGFWATMGDYSLNDLEDSSDGNCTNQYPKNSTSFQKSCPTQDGRYSIPILLGAYVVFVQILMFNLLIALFNNAITDNEAKRDMIWRYQRFQLTMQYAESKVLLPPFILLYFFLIGKAGNPFKSQIEEEYIALKDFERCSAQKIINQITKGSYGKEVSNGGKKDKVKKIESKVDKILKLLEKQ
ncbi:transient receptor potential cation channel subfamily M member 2, partial [Biomphalaria pfeifferi]